MGATVGRETDPVGFFAALAERPYEFDFYQTLRRIECLYRDKPRWGEALRPVDEPVRLGQAPELTFAPAPLASFEAGEGGPPRLNVRLFGLLGPNGPLPLHITEHVRDRMYNANDPTTGRFFDLLQHRFLAFFYRAWAQSQPHVNRDRPETDRFAAYIGAFLGLSTPSFRGRDDVPDVAKLFHVGTLIRHVRNAEGLSAVLQHFFRVPVRIEEYVGHWMSLGPRERTYLGREGATLGQGALVGARIWDRQHKFRIALGPLTFEQYESFLPGGLPLKQLVDWVRLYLCFELEWDVRLVLAHTEVPPLRVGRVGRLGWTTWLGQRQGGEAVGDLCLDAERFVAGAGEAA
jgi:type VI secretion system protein ImpH